jgi:lipid-A-disaccharide synthase
VDAAFDGQRLDARRYSRVISGGDPVTAPNSPVPAQREEWLFVSVGDVSADLHAARLIRKLKVSMPHLKYFGIGGSAMEAEGVELLFNTTTLGVIGIMGVVKAIPLLAAVQKDVLERISQRKPSAVLCVDYGGFNLSLAGKVKKQDPNMPVIYFISPQVWGSRPWRINKIARAVNTMLCIFPFEETLYRKRGINAHFVGHPLLEKLAEETDNRDLDGFYRRYNLDPERPIVGIFPGSRKSEIRNFMGFLMQAVNWIHADRPDVQFVISAATQFIYDEVDDQIQRTNLYHLVGPTVKIIPNDDNYNMMAASTLVWAKSGTTTLEVGLMEKPMLVFYRADWISFVIFLLFKRVKWVAWPNLLAGEMLVPELIQLDCRAEQLVRYTGDWLDVPGLRHEIADKLRLIKKQLGKGDFAANAALEVQNTLERTTAH